MHHLRADHTVPRSSEYRRVLYSKALQLSKPARKQTRCCVLRPTAARSKASSATGGPRRSQFQLTWPTRRRSRIVCEETMRLSSSVLEYRVEPRHSRPRRRREELAALALFLPYSIHHAVGNVSDRFRPGSGWASPLQRWREDTTRNQSLFLLGIILRVERNDPSHRFIPVADENFLARAYTPYMGAKASLQFRNINGTHDTILTQHDHIGHVTVRQSPFSTPTRRS